MKVGITESHAAPGQKLTIESVEIIPLDIVPQLKRKMSTGAFIYGDKGSGQGVPSWSEFTPKACLDGAENTTGQSIRRRNRVKHLQQCQGFLRSASHRPRCDGNSIVAE